MLTDFCARGISQSSDHRVVHSRCYSKLDKDMLEEILLDDSWGEIFSIDDVLKCLYRGIYSCNAAHIGCYDTFKKMRIKRTCSSWSHDADITIAQHRRDWLHCKALKSGNSEDWA